MILKEIMFTFKLQVCITAVFLYQHLGSSALVGLAVIIFFMPVQYKIACILAKIQTSTLVCWSSVHCLSTAEKLPSKVNNCHSLKTKLYEQVLRKTYCL